MNRVIAIVGYANSGKTELICRLLEWFQRQGLNVAVLKHTHHQEVADTGKDTGRYRRAGASLVALAAPGLVQVTRTYTAEPPLAEALAPFIEAADLVLVEGYKSSQLPKIAVLGREAGDAAPALPPFPNIVALVSPTPPAGSPWPVFNPAQVDELGRFILSLLGLPQPQPET